MDLRQITNTAAVGFALTLLAACGTAPATTSTSASMLGIKTSTVDTLPTGVHSAVLPAGDYVVTFQRTEACQSHELNLKQTRKLDVPAGAAPEVHVASAGDVRDNLMHPRICFERPAPSPGTLALSLDRPTKVVGDALLIASADRVTDRTPESFTDADAVLPAGSYLVHLTGKASCRDVELDVTKSLVYGPGHALTVALAAGGVVQDDLIRPEICRPNAKASATVYLTLRTPAKLATAGLTVASVSRITASEPVTVR